MCRQIRDDLGPHVSTVARVAGDCAPSGEVLLVDGVDHVQHAARRTLQRGLIGKSVPGANAFGHVAIDAVQAERGGKHPHGVHELIDGNSSENFDILEEFLSHRLSVRLSSLRRAARRGNTQHAHEQSTDDANNDSPRSGLHVVPLVTKIAQLWSERSICGDNVCRQCEAGLARALSLWERVAEGG